MNNFRKPYYLLLLLMLFLGSCTGTRKLAEDEHLARNGKVIIEDRERFAGFSEMNMELAKMAEVGQNNRFLWMRMRLSIHNSIKAPDKEKGFKYWLKYKVGREPVLYNPRQTERVKKTMNEYLFNNSFFHSEIVHSLKQNKHTITPVYSITTGKSYLIDSVKYIPSGYVIDTTVMAWLDEIQPKSHVPFSIDKLKEKRNEISFDILNSGHYYFRPDYFEFVADTLDKAGTVDLSLKIKDNTPSEAFNRYRINKVVVEDNFIYDSVYKVDTQLVNGIYYLSPELYIKPKVVTNAVHLFSDSLYNRDAHLRTLNHLRSLNVYKFVNIIYEKDDSITDGLNSRLVLVPLSKMSVSGELNANVKSNNFAGPGVILSFTNRNTFKSAEVLSVNFSGRFETQMGKSIQGNTSYEVRMDGNLRLPRLYPFKSRRIKSQNLPFTSINIGGALQERIEWYQMVNWNTTMRYSWRSAEKVSQRYSPLDINLTSLLKTSQKFDEYLEDHPSTRRSFEEQFIVGMNYDFYYSKSADRLNTPFFFSLTLDMSGNALTLANMVSGNTLMETDTAYNSDSTYNVQNKLFGTPYAQYVRSVVDVRKNFKLWSKHSIATRLILAGGYPYGNSTVMPYVKQFYVGGANSLRGFQARSVGPGTFHDTTSNSYIDQAGDLKFEANIEYRFPLWGNLQSAFFTDIGNIWLVNEDESRPGAEFSSKKGTIQMAVSSGIGLRYEISPIIIRFDWAWPMRYPYKVNSKGEWPKKNEESKNWVVDQINFADPEWRKKNLILNISLGYPF